MLWLSSFSAHQSRKEKGECASPRLTVASTHNSKSWFGATLIPQVKNEQELLSIYKGGAFSRKSIRAFAKEMLIPEFLQIL